MRITKGSLIKTLIILLISVLISSYLRKTSKNNVKITQKMTSFREIHGVTIEKNPPQSKLDHLRVSSWKMWSGEPGKMPWTFEAEETMYLLEGKVKISVEGHEETFYVEAGDLAVFPKGMKITWDVLEAVNKHYSVKK